ncbi:MAG: hypothetical protein J6V53_02570 [Alphaproteobacteria bacterium]|nr:hypothetical protein [Alphaproteobacteria bacterium]
MRFCFICAVFAATVLSFQITKPLNFILQEPQTLSFLNDILTKPAEEITQQIITQDSQEKQLFYSLINNAAKSLRDNHMLQNLSAAQFLDLIKKALLIQQILFIALFYLLFMFLFYIAYFILKSVGPYFYQPEEKRFWMNILSLPFCLILIIYTIGLSFDIVFSPFLLLIIAILISLILTTQIKNNS